MKPNWTAFEQAKKQANAAYEAQVRQINQTMTGAQWNAAFAQVQQTWQTAMNAAAEEHTAANPQIYNR